MNRVLEYEPGKFLAATWDNTKLIFIDHQNEKLEQTIEHPSSKDQPKTRCWGLLKVPDYHTTANPFIISRDNTGLILVNVRAAKSFKLSDSAISANLFGHGNILRVQKTLFNTLKICTVMQDKDTGKGLVGQVEMPLDFSSLLQKLLKL